MSYTFNISSNNIKEDIAKAERGITEAGGSFDNNHFEIDTKIGFFSGSYTTDTDIEITIEKKPIFVPMSSVEKYVRGVFKG